MDKKPTSLPQHYLDAAQPWTEDIKWQKKLIVDGPSFQAWADSFVPQVLDKPVRDGLYDMRPECFFEIGRYKLSRRILPQFIQKQNSCHGFTWGRPYWDVATLELSRSGRADGWVGFVGDVYIPVLIEGDNPRDVWMSITPMEWLSQRPCLRKAKGTVLIGGLGMGMIARAVKKKKGVDKVVVVERCPEVIQFFSESVSKAEGCPVQFIQGDFYAHAEHFSGEYDSILADIWKGSTDASWDKRFQAIKRQHPRVWGWGDYSTAA